MAKGNTPKHATWRYPSMQRHCSVERSILFRSILLSTDTMISIENLRLLFDDTALAGRDIVPLRVLDTQHWAYAIQIGKAEVEPMWRVARGLVDRTGLWPVASCAWGSHGDWRKSVLSEDFFSRFYYREAPGANDVSPTALLRMADQVDVDTFVDDLVKLRGSYFALDKAIRLEVDTTRHTCGIAPTEQEIAAARAADKNIDSHAAFDRWLMHWEAAHGVPLDRSLGRQDWFEQDPAVLLLLPTENSWDALAYLHWFGSSQPGAQYFIALGRRWRQRYGAELVAHYGTMLQCLVSRPPQTLDEAWSLAREHDLASPSTLALPGIALRHHALGLVDHDRWFLHERP